MYCDLPEFARCCFCMPLRRGVLTFGYINILFSILMTGSYSYAVHRGKGVFLLYRGMAGDFEAEVCLAIYCIDIVFYLILLYGAHKRVVSYLKIFYYYMITTTGALVVTEIISAFKEDRYLLFEMIGLFMAGQIINLYLLFLVRSLIKKMEHTVGGYGNPMQEFVNRDLKEENGIPNTVVITENA